MMGESMNRRRRGQKGSASAPTARVPGKRMGSRWSGKDLPPGVAKFAGRLAALAAVGLGSGYLIATHVFFPLPPPPGDLVAVPSLAGLKLDDVSARLADAGLALGTVEALRHPDLDSGVVVGQGPLAGQLLPRGGQVRLTMSLGPQRQTVPDISRLVGDRALRMLEATGFEVTVDSTDSDLPIGSIVEVDPPAGTLLRVPAAVKVTVSRGPARFPMPYLLGMPGKQAIDSLTVLGLGVPVVDTVFRFGRDQGLVEEQDPPADSLVSRGASVRLTVGRSGG